MYWAGLCLGIYLGGALLVAVRPSPSLYCGRNSMYCSGTQACISTRLMCNGRNDCPTGEDESPRYCHSSCPLMYFACGPEQCIPTSYVCEGPSFTDCVNGLDEAAELCASGSDSSTKALTAASSVSGSSAVASTTTSTSARSSSRASDSTTGGISTKGVYSSTTEVALSSEVSRTNDSVTLSSEGTNFSGIGTTPEGMPDPNVYCDRVTVMLSARRNVTLPRESAGKTIVLLCFSSGQLLLSATCQRLANIHQWTVAASYNITLYNVSCTDEVSDSTQRLEDLSFETITESNALSVTEELVNLTSSVVQLEPADIAYAARIFDKLALYYGSANSTRILAQATPMAASVVSSLMDADAAVVERSRKGDAVVSRIIENFDEILLRSAEALMEAQTLVGAEEKLVVESPNVVYQITSGRTVAGLRLCRLSNSTSVTTTMTYGSPDASDCPGESLATIKLSQTAASGVPRSYALYNNAKLFGQGTAPGAFVLSSQISRKAPHSSPLVGSELVTFTQEINKSAVYDGLRLVCGYWSFASDSWATAGCHSRQAESSSTVVCTCNHLTNFAVLMVPASLRPNDEHSTVLSYLSIVCLSISSLALVLVILTVLCYSQLRRADAPRLTACLSASLLCLNILFIFGIDGSDDEDSCVAVAAALHYFLLTSFMFMTAEALLYYLKLVKVLGVHISYFIWKVGAVSLGIPAIVVIAIRFGDAALYGAGIEQREEVGRGGGEEEADASREGLCWVQQTLQVYGVIIPIGVAILVNSVVFALIVRALKCGTRIRSSMTDQRLERLQAKALAAVFTVLGITWLFGLLAFVEDASTVFQYLFCISNSLQGVLIFVFHAMKTPFIVNCLKLSLPGSVSSTTGYRSDENHRRKSAMSLSTTVVTSQTTGGHSQSRLSTVTPPSKTVQQRPRGQEAEFV